MATDRVDARNETLGSKDLISQAYQQVLNKYPHQALTFATGAPQSLLEDDGDYHTWGRSRQGWMHYDQVAIVRVGGKSVALALGTRTEGYPADDYDFDLKIFPFVGNAQDIKTTIMRSPGLSKSAIVGFKSAGIRANDQILGAMVSEFDASVVQRPELNRELVNFIGFGAPILDKTVRYSPEYAQVVADAIARFLER